MNNKLCLPVMVKSVRSMANLVINLSIQNSFLPETTILLDRFSVTVKHVDYSKCHRIWYANGFEKLAYANSVDPDQNAPKGAV